MNRVKYQQKYTVITILFVTIILQLLLGCGGGGTKYTLTVTASPAGGGTVDPSGGSFDSGSQVILAAKSNDGFVFKNWSGDLSGTSERNTIEMDDNKSVVANFVRTNTVALYVHQNPDDGGTVEPAGGNYAIGTKLIVSARPAEGYTFDHWEGDASGTGENVSVTMNQEKRIIAHFTKNCTLNVRIDPQGAGKTDPSGGSYEKDTEITVTAIPSYNYDFVHWEGDVNSESELISITMDTDMNLIAKFTRYSTAKAPWPTFRNNPQHTGLSKYNGTNVANTKWEFKTGGPIISSPAIGSNGMIYFGSRDNKLYALKSDGTLKWSFDSGGSIDTSPTIRADEIIYFGSRNNTFYALNTDGSVRWKYETDSPISSSPVLDTEGIVYFGSNDGNLYALNSNGTLKWKYETGSYVKSSPAIGTDGTIYFGSDDEYLYALNPNGTLKWSFDAGNDVQSSPAIGTDGTIYFGSNNQYIYALNSDGSLKWNYRTQSWVLSSPGIGPDGTIYIGSNDGFLYALNPDGTLKWNFETSKVVRSSPAIGANGNIYFGSNDSYLYAIDKDGSLIWQYEVGGESESSPVIGEDGTIYFGSNYRYLHAIGK